MIVTTFGFVGGPISPCFVRIELRVERGMLFRLSGVSGSSAKSAKARIRSALLSCGYRWPGKAITVNIAPADLSRTSTSYDLPIALCILAAEGHISKCRLKIIATSGEMSLDGSLWPISTSTNITQNVNSHFIHKSEIKELLHPTVHPAKTQISGTRQIEKHSSSTYSHLKEVITYLRNTKNKAKKENTNTPLQAAKKHPENSEINSHYSFANIKGEPTAKRKAIIAAAGNHHIILMGPPGSGKSVLAKCIHALLPKSNNNRPPWQAPHSSTGVGGLIGAWNKTREVGVIPGAWSLAHQGVLFLDEWPEFSRSALESCRVPMETGRVALSRAAGSVELTSEALLIAALNPCPCGQLTKSNGICFCTPGEVRNYLKKVSGPVADRFVIHLELGNEINLEVNTDDYGYLKTNNNTKRAEIDDKTELLHDNSKFYDKKELKMTQTGKENCKEHKKRDFFDVKSGIKGSKKKEKQQKSRFYEDNLNKMIDNEELCNVGLCEKRITGGERFIKTVKDDKTSKNLINKDFIDKNYTFNDKKLINGENGEVSDDEFWGWAVKRVEYVRKLKIKGVKLYMTNEAREWLEGFQQIACLSERGIKNIIDVANTAALIDNSPLIEKEHIVEGAESRLFDRNTWLQSITDGSIPKYIKDLKPKLAACKINVL